MFRRPALLSLTIDRDGCNTGRGFESAQAAHQFVTKERAIARLLRLLGVKRWVWVLEFQQKSGDGWPHWHVLIDLHGVYGNDLRGRIRKAWRLWRDTWRIGGLDLQLRKRFQQVDHAIQYVTKYLTKYPERGFPAWVLESSRLRFCASSREVGAIVSTPRDTPETDTPGTGKPRAEARPMVDRMAECGEQSTVFAVSHDRHGEERLHYMTSVPVKVDELPFVLQFAGQPELLQSEHEQVELVSVNGTHCTINRINWLIAPGDVPSIKRIIRNCEELAVMREERMNRCRLEMLAIWDLGSDALS